MGNFLGNLRSQNVRAGFTKHIKRISEEIKPQIVHFLGGAAIWRLYQNQKLKMNMVTRIKDFTYVTQVSILLRTILRITQKN